MVHVLFKNLKPSVFAKESVVSRVSAVASKFPDLMGQDVHVTIDAPNGPQHPGRDLYVLKLRVISGRYAGLTLERGGMEFYPVLADLVDRLLELLNRAGDKRRVRRIRSARSLKSREPQAV